MDDSRVLADTSAWVVSLRQKGLPAIRGALDRYLEENRIYLFGMIAVELLAGTRTEPEFKNLKDRLLALHWIEWKEFFWERAADHAFHLGRLGINIPSADLLVATVAIESGCALLHYDKHFDSLARHLPLKLIHVSGQVI